MLKESLSMVRASGVTDVNLAEYLAMYITVKTAQ